ncbi:MAG TPA: hypothetical protein VNC61_07580 [Acidimicrobiales bacterium]|nr:hypothetical protein [Acidimicrobiales bacterium]
MSMETEVEEQISLGSEILTDEGRTHYFVKESVRVKGEIVEFGEREITDFTMKLTNRIQVGGDAAQIIFEVEIKNKTWQIPSAVLSSLAKWRVWCNARGLGWSGKDFDLIGIFDMLVASEGPTLHGVNVVGLHDDTFVLPDEVVGPQGVYAFVPPPAGDLWSRRTNLVKDPRWEMDALKLLAQLHQPDVITPILGWIAAAPLRVTVKKFPPLVISGGSGFGKTTLLETILDTFGFWTAAAISLTSGSTPYTVSAECASSNALPVWFDEYRGSTFGRDDTRRAIQQAVRDAFDGASTEKGGGGADHMLINPMPVCAPLIISGEDSLTEISHVERAVIVNMPRSGRNREALDELRDCWELDGTPVLHRQGIGRAYLEWLLEVQADPDRQGRLRMPQPTERPELGQEIVKWGYGLLCDFVGEHNDGIIDMPSFDGTRIAADQLAASDTNPIFEAIAEARSVAYPDEMVWEEDGCIYVRVGALCSWTKKNRDIILPGGAQAVKAWLRENCGAKDDEVERYTARVRVSWWKMP